MTESALKKVIKQAVIEVVREERELFADALRDVMEDIALSSAIREGRKSKPVQRERVLRALKGGRR